MKEEMLEKSSIIGRTESDLKKYGESPETDRAFIILADHMRASVFLVADGVTPSSKEQGYLLRRLLRRCVRFAEKLELPKGFTKNLTEAVAQIFEEPYPELKTDSERIKQVLFEEEEKFGETLERGLRELEHILAFKGTLSGKDAFLLYESYGFPYELSLEIAQEKNAVSDVGEVEKGISLGSCQRISNEIVRNTLIHQYYMFMIDCLLVHLNQLLPPNIHS